MNDDQFQALLDYLKRNPDAALNLADELVGHIVLNEDRIETSRHWSEMLLRQTREYEARQQQTQGGDQ